MNKYITLLQLAVLHEIIAKQGSVEDAIYYLEGRAADIWADTEPCPSSYYEEDFHNCMPVWEAQVEVDRVLVLISFLELMLPAGQNKRVPRTIW